VVGQGTGTGFHFRPGPFNSASRVDDLTIEGTIAAPSISVDSAGLHVNNVDDHGGGIVVVHGNQPRVDNYLFDGPGRGMVIDATDGGRLANITIQNCSEGVTLTGGLSPGAVTTEVLGMTIKHCGLGLRLGTLPQTPGGPPPSFQGFVQDIHLIDNAIAILVQDGDSFVSNAVIEDDPTTPAVPATAVRVENGSLNLSFTQITGHTAGLDVDTLATAGRGRVVAGFVSIVGGDVGMRLRAFDRGTSVTFGGLDIRDQTTAALQVDGVEILDTFGPNTLSVLSGFAIDDRRTVIQPDRTELGLVRTTLNGHSYAGQVLRGPLSIGSDIRIASPDAVWGFQGP
jgi:hypothetical protein